MSAAMFSVSSPNVVFTDGTIQFLISLENNRIQKRVLETLFRQHIICLRCVDKDSNVELDNMQVYKMCKIFS